MSNTTPIVTTMSTTVSDFLNTYVSSVSASLSAAVLPIIAGGMTLYTLVYGYAILRGDVQQPIQQFLWKNFKVLMICGIGLGIGIKQSAILNLFNSFQGWLTASLVGNGASGSFVNILETYLDSVTNSLINLVNAATVGSFTAAGGTTGSSQGGWVGALKAAVNFGAVITALITGFIFTMISWNIFLFSFLLAACAMIVFLSAQIGLAACLAVSPIFIACLCFDKTARYFDTWLSQALNYCFVSGLIGMVLGLSLSALNTQVTNIQTLLVPVTTGGGSVLTTLGDIGVGLISYDVLILMCIWFFFQCPNVASGLVGGSSLGNPVRDAYNVAKKVMTKGADSMGKTGGDMKGVSSGSSSGGSVSQNARHGGK